jgi:hypothetical protein
MSEGSMQIGKKRKKTYFISPMHAFLDWCLGTVTENFHLPLPSSVAATVTPCSALGILSWKLKRRLNQRYAELF